MAVKIIVVGAVNGQLRPAFSKLATLHAKADFSFAIITGDLFAEDDNDVADLLAERIAIPLPTYFTVGMSPLPQSVVERLSKDKDLCDNLYYLGKRSTTKTSEGLRIVSLGGIFDKSNVAGLSSEQILPFHTLDDAKALRGANTADILLTTSWPASIRTGSKVPLTEAATAPPGYDHISDLCLALKPRYHFSSASNFFYEREPFFHLGATESPDVRHITRFISLAKYGNPAKQKALYAFNLQPTADVTVPIPVGTTGPPFQSHLNGTKRPATDPEPFSRFSNGDDRPYHRHKRGRRDKQAPPGPDECFFCLSNPNIGTHLVVSIGEDSYVTIAKGPLTTSTTYHKRGLEFPAHILIIPLTHSATIAQIPDEDSRQSTYREMDRYKSTLQSMIAFRSANKLGAVTYEVSRGFGIHTHWQCLPMPADMIQKGLVEAAFLVEAENLKYPKFLNRDPGMGEGEGDYFRVWIWSPPDEDFKDGSMQCLTLPLGNDFRFDLQFGRRVLAKLLGLEKRLQWRDCEQMEEEEIRDAAAFKAAFAQFDFS